MEGVGQMRGLSLPGDARLQNPRRSGMSLLLAYNIRGFIDEYILWLK